MSTHIKGNREQVGAYSSKNRTAHDFSANMRRVSTKVREETGV